MTPEQFSERPVADRWLTAEHAALVGVARLAARTPDREHSAWRLARMVSALFVDTGRLRDLIALHDISLGAAQRTGDPRGLAYAHYGLAVTATGQGRYGEADRHLAAAQRLFDATDELDMQANVEFGRAVLHERQDAWSDALDRVRRAHRLYEVARSRWGIAASLNTMGWYLSHLGDHESALAYCERSLAMRQGWGDRPGAMATWDSIGHIRLQLDDPDGAVSAYLAAADIARDTPREAAHATILEHLGSAYAAAGDPTSALATWHQALAVLDRLHHPAADRVRHLLGAS